MNKRKMISILLIGLSLSTGISIHKPIISNAETNITLPGNAGRAREGSSYWTSSNMREWLNSDAKAGSVK